MAENYAFLAFFGKTQRNLSKYVIFVSRKTPQSMKEIINDRVYALRNCMKEQLLDAVIITNADPHGSEYTTEYWKAREWIAGFDGSAGTAVLTLTEAFLWTDSRYWLAAEEQLEGTPFQLMKDGMPGTPSIKEWLLTNLGKGATVGVDGRVTTMAEMEELGGGANTAHLKLKQFSIDNLWENRPILPLNAVEIQPLEFAGVSARDKIQLLRDKLSQMGADSIVVTQLDEVAWLTNLRGSDVHCNPVFMAYLLVTKNKAILMAERSKLTEDVLTYLKNEGINTAEYDDLELIAHVSTVSEKPMLIDPNTTNQVIGSLAIKKSLHPSPIPAMKAVKNEAEIRGFRDAHLRDGVAMVKFLRWVQSAIKTEHLTELSVAEKLENLRSQGALYRGISFDTISAYAEHGAIVHYEPTLETDMPLKAQGLLLLDSGAQYQDGTTDITRTIALGKLTAQEKEDYTLVLKGHIRLAMACFPVGTCGTQLDVLARFAMWQQGINYGHGTGHGVGSYLNVHEGPHQIRMNYKPAPLLNGMTVTNEPGIYRAGKHGVRIENTMLVQPYKNTEFGEFLQLKPLTLCPIDTTPIIREWMSTDEVEYLNQYHERVYRELSPLLNEEENDWLKKMTKGI